MFAAFDQLSERGKQFQALFANAFVRGERIGESVVWYLRKPLKSSWKVAGLRPRDDLLFGASLRCQRR